MGNELVRRLRESWPTIRVVGTFVVTIYIAFFILTYDPLVSRIDISMALARALAWISFGFLSVIGAIAGFPVIIEGTNLASDAFRVDVAPACSGAVPSMIYLSAVFAYPAPLRTKLVGAGIGLAIIQGVNLIRVIALFLVGLYVPALFHDIHVYVAQGLVVAVAVATWLFWAGRFVHAPGR